MVKIRLTQTGKRNSKKYRIVVMDKAERRDGKVIEILGIYNPLVKPAEINFKKDRIDYWVSKGAQITESVTRLIKPE